MACQDQEGALFQDAHEAGDLVYATNIWLTLQWDYYQVIDVKNIVISITTWYNFSQFCYWSDMVWKWWSDMVWKWSISMKWRSFDGQGMLWKWLWDLAALEIHNLIGYNVTFNVEYVPEGVLSKSSLCLILQLLILATLMNLILNNYSKEIEHENVYLRI